jgi:hypothetical protein
VAEFYELARQFAEGGHEVTLFLVQNGVLGARAEAHDEALRNVARSRVRILADDFSLRERAIEAASLGPGVQRGTMDTVVQLLAAGAKSLWN